MTQWIITIGILILVFIFTILKLVRAFRRPKGESTSPCGSCSSDCASCPFLSRVNFPNNLEEKS
jgi:ABC-type Co2+ transport system permease subunit